MSNVMWSLLGNHAIASFSENISTAFDVSEGVKGAEIIKSYTSNCVRKIEWICQLTKDFLVVSPFLNYIPSYRLAFSVVKKKPAVIDILYNLSLDIEN